MKVLTAREMATMDRLATEKYGVPSLTLMENAGRQVAEAAAAMAGDFRHREIVLFCGKGNNGGDGLVAARHLLQMGGRPRIYLLGSFQDLKEDPRTNLDMATRAGVEIKSLTGESDLGAIRRDAAGAALVVDAVFGTGFTPPARGLYSRAISLINEIGLPVLAVDIPSGLSADHGRLAGETVSAHRTVTFGLPKVGQLLYPAAERCGSLYLADIGFPGRLEEEISSSHHLITAADAGSLLSPRAPESHKGTFGHVLLVAGSWGFAGASVLAARGALRAGAGLVTVALPESQAPPSLDGLPEAMILPLPETSRGTASEQALEIILEHLPGKRALALGPGLSQNPETGRLVRTLIPQVPIPTVIDADGLNALAGHTSVLMESSSEIVITPHPGELGRLLGLTAAEVQERRIEVAVEFSKKYGVTVALKGARTVVAAPSGQTYLNPTGNTGMATGGMGDVLTGMIASLIAQGHAPLSATTLGVYLHGLAGDLASAERGPWGYLAGEVADGIPSAAGTLLATKGNDRTATESLRLLLP